jgi:hypothetical protein
MTRLLTPMVALTAALATPSRLRPATADPRTVIQTASRASSPGRRTPADCDDNNYPGSDGRWIARDKPDDVELIVVRARALRSAPMVPRMDEFVARGRVGSECYAAEARR